MPKHAKYPQSATRMRRDALHLKRIVADLTRYVAAARKDYGNEDLRNMVRDYACEVERLATCLRADALDVQSAANDDGYGW